MGGGAGGAGGGNVCAQAMADKDEIIAADATRIIFMFKTPLP